jgi:hypothetical protein
MTSTDEGMQIDESPEQSENADSPSAEILQPRSNVTLERFGHLAKQYAGMISTEEGM